MTPRAVGRPLAKDSSGADEFTLHSTDSRVVVVVVLEGLTDDSDRKSSFPDVRWLTSRLTGPSGGGGVVEPKAFPFPGLVAPPSPTPTPAPGSSAGAPVVRTRKGGGHRPSDRGQLDVDVEGLWSGQAAVP